MKTPSRLARLARRAYFSSAHRYFNPEFSEEQNRAIFGSCYSPYGHGHNYILEAYFEGPVDPQTGMVINLTDVDQLLKEVTKELDHHHLNFDVEHFRDRVPTTENLAAYCYDQIKAHLKSHPEVRLYKVRLYEGEDLWVDYGAPADMED